jgi:hypothetical protein
VRTWKGAAAPLARLGRHIYRVSGVEDSKREWVENEVGREAVAIGPNLKQAKPFIFSCSKSIVSL